MEGLDARELIASLSHLRISTSCRKANPGVGAAAVAGMWDGVGMDEQSDPVFAW